MDNDSQGTSGRRRPLGCCWIWGYLWDNMLSMEKGKRQLEIQGQIERITYFNEENNYTIAKVRVQGKQGLLTVVGTLFSVSPGETLCMEGFWESHPKYGDQLRVTAYRSVLPATAAGIEKYLGSGMIKGIGPVTAKRLVTRFGDKTLAVIEEEIERLGEVEGIGEKRIDMIRRAWEDQKEIRDVMIFLQGQGVSPTYAVKIYRHYGRDAVKVVSENPYKLATDIFGIGFITADKIAEKLGIEKDSRVRTEAGILYVLNELADDGHVYYPLDALVEKCAKVLDVEEGRIPPALDAIACERKVVIERQTRNSKLQTLSPEPRDARPETRDPGRETQEPSPGTAAVYLAVFHASETGVAERLRNLLAQPKQLGLVNVDEAVAWAQDAVRLSLSQNQTRAVTDAIQNKVMVVTGGPGTGKTTIINAIIRIYRRMGQKVFLAAPTGRAAKRMTEATGYEAKTLHRLLEYSPGGPSGAGGFKRDEQNPLETDLIVVDEASMVDTVLMYQFLKAVPERATLILVGDVDQLPSVGPGNVLKDIISSGCVPTVRLTEIFRQARESMIILNAHRINKGLMPAFDYGEGEARDFFFYPIEEPETVVERIVQLCRSEIPSRFGYDPLRDIQVITPMHRGTAGVANLNVVLQRELNPAREELLRGGRSYRVGDKVMQVRNNYDKGVYNGDIGRIAAIDREEQEVVVDYEGRRVSYDFPELDELFPAYAVSVHKSQGSEYPVVIMPVLTQHYMLLQRNLLYTGVTRGKRLVILMGTKKALAIAIKNDKPQKRYTLLRERLMGAT
jgi:exodeoxyribonuclease V alpha subunit